MISLQMDPLDSHVPTIEWEMMDKVRFCQLTMLNSFTVRGLLYPFTVIKTRLQIQKHKALYSGTFDAFRKIIRTEGPSGLYKGFWVNSIQIVSGSAYIMTYENMRHMLTKHVGIENCSVKGLIAGGVGSLISQTIVTPFDVVSQHMMMHGQLQKVKAVTETVDAVNVIKQQSKQRLASSIISNIYKNEGLKGFYRGYFASCCCYVPTSALWWMFYPEYTKRVASVVPNSTSHLLVCAIAGPLSGITVAFITNPLDIIRAKIQIQRLNSFVSTAKELFAEEGFKALSKGLSARLLQTTISSFFIVIGYESLKRFSIQDSYKDQFRW